MLASLTVGTLILNGSTEIVHQNALSRLKYETNIKSLKLVADIKNLSGDAQYLAGTPPIKGIPRAAHNAGIDPLDNSNIETWKARLATIFSELIRAKPNYLQIRYIGVADGGRELIRVERKGTSIQTTSKENLQQKGQSTYFIEAAKSHPGEVYLSDVTLNREYNKISEPHTPVIRAATPIYFDDKLFGILVINMAFGQIFNQLISNTPRELTPYVTNETGFFLAHPDTSKTYGFDLETNHKIQSIYPGLDLASSKDLRDVEFSFNAQGDVVHIVKAHYDPAKQSRFFAVMLATSLENLNSGSDNLRYQGFLIMAILVVISLILAAVLVTRLMQPLKLITIASENLAMGKEVSNLPVTSGDEIGELARSFQTMYQKIEDKEHELIISQSRVHHANKMASLGEMASGMAHEINTPIQAISFTAQRVQRLLDKNPPKEELNASMTSITENVTKIADIIDSLRKVSRDSTADDFRSTLISVIIDDLVNITEERFRVKGIKFSVNYHGQSERSAPECQHLQISQVLINLVNNAYDAVSTLSEKWIILDIYEIDNKVKITITDSGKGIENEIIDKLFEPLFTTKEIGEGTGLGLSISSEIVKNHNGTLYLDTESEFTRFVLELPLFHLTDSQIEKQ